MAIKYDDAYIKKPLEPIEYTPEMVLELQKCSANIENFLPYVKIIHPDLGRIKFEPYQFQKTILNTIQNNRFLCILAARQCGKSTVISTYALWYAIFNNDKTIGIVSNKSLSAIDIMSRIKIIYEELPSFLKPGVSEYSKTFVTFDNGSKIVVSATSADAFRGKTLNLLVCLGGENYVTVRDKITGEIKNITIEELYKELNECELDSKIV